MTVWSVLGILVDMPETTFEYEERYKETDPIGTRRKLELAKFVLSYVQTQIDHWFIPGNIMSPDEQAQWFDYERGYALRIREETNDENQKAIITSKQLLNPADHSAMTNNEASLTVAGMARVLSVIGDEFTPVIHVLDEMEGEKELTFGEAKQLIESVGRKEYITLEKTRSVYRSDEVADIEVDMDIIPALQSTALGFWASVEIEYTGQEPLEEARVKVRKISHELGYNERDILKKALPGLAIPYLAKF